MDWGKFRCPFTPMVSMKESANFYSSQLRKMGIVTFKNKDGAFSAKGIKIPLRNP